MIPLFGVDGEGATLVSLDDQVLSQDRGAQFTASVTPEPFNLAGGGMGTLRRFTQEIILSGSATVQLTPETDRVSAAPSSFAVAGPVAQVELDLAEQGRRATVTVAVTAHVGLTELGESAQAIVGRRTTAT